MEERRQNPTLNIAKILNMKPCKNTENNKRSKGQLTLKRERRIDCLPERRRKRERGGKEFDHILRKYIFFVLMPCLE